MLKTFKIKMKKILLLMLISISCLSYGQVVNNTKDTLVIQHIPTYDFKVDNNPTSDQLLVAGQCNLMIGLGSAIMGTMCLVPGIVYENKLATNLGTGLLIAGGSLVTISIPLYCVGVKKHNKNKCCFP
jgi:hypothetical protein